MDPEEENEGIGPEESGQEGGGDSSLGGYDDSHIAGKSLGDYNKDSNENTADKGDSPGKNTDSNIDKKGEGSDKKGSEKGDKGAGEKTGTDTGDKGSSATKSRVNALRNKGRQLKGAVKDPKGTAEELLKAQVKKRIILAAGGALFSTGGLIFLTVILAGFLMVAMIQGAQQEAMTTGFCESITGDLSCLAKKAKSPSFDPCYYNALRDAEKETDVPWQILAAVDFKAFNQGAADDRGLTNAQALHQLGHEIQNANYKRNPVTGEIFIGDKGEPDKGISLKGSYNDPQDFLNAAVVMKHWECMYLTAGKYTGENLQNLLECYKCETNDALSETLKDKWISQNSLVAGMSITGNADWKNTGALSFYNYLMQNCEAIGMKSEKNSGGGGGTTLPPGTIGQPGERDGNNIPILPNYKQGDWGGDGNPSSWAGRIYDFFGCDMASCGCSIASASMVLSWYGCSMDPGQALDVANANYHGGTDMGGVFGVLGSSCGLCTKQVPGVQGIKDFLNSTHEPMIVGVNGTMDRHYIGGHFVAVAGFDGTNYTVYDPGQNGPMVSVPAGEFESYVTSDGDNWAFYKSSGGGCQ